MTRDDYADVLVSIQSADEDLQDVELWLSDPAAMPEPDPHLQQRVTLALQVIYSIIRHIKLKLEEPSA